MSHLVRMPVSKLFRRAIPIVPAALLMVASCAQSTPNASNDEGDGGTGVGSSGMSGSGSGAGSTGAAGDDSATGSSGGGSGGAADDSGGASTGNGNGGSADDSGTAGIAHDSGAASSDAGGGTGHDAGGGGARDAGGGTGGSCTHNNAVCSADNTGCNVGSYYLYDNQWNCGSGSGNACGPESAYGCANSDGTVSWVTTSNQPKGNTAVLTYPAMQDNFGSSPALNSFTAISSTFTETSPHLGDYEVAWDCWFNNNANEFMVWVDTYNQVPAGPKVATGVSLGGRTYDIYWAPSGGGGGTVSFYATTNFTSGTVNLLQLFNYGVSNGWLPSSSKLNQISFGTEVCSTNGTSATWTVSDYSVTAH